MLTVVAPLHHTPFTFPESTTLLPPQNKVEPPAVIIEAIGCMVEFTTLLCRDIAPLRERKKIIITKKSLCNSNDDYYLLSTTVAPPLSNAPPDVNNAKLDVAPRSGGVCSKDIFGKKAK